MASYNLTPELKKEYENNFNYCTPTHKDIDYCIKMINKNKLRYEKVTVNNIPWYVVGIIHGLECSFDFTKHLHNGDPLTARTSHIPIGRPLFGEPPYEWEYSAQDALGLRRKQSDWSIGGIAYYLECYNGFGYRTHNVPSPYLWSGSNIYKSGKFVKDKVFDIDAVSKQVGGMVILKKMFMKGMLSDNSNQSSPNQMASAIMNVFDSIKNKFC